MSSYFDPTEIKKATCQLYKTYLPPSYMPPTCQDLDEHWAWSFINTVFVGSITIFNTTIFLLVTFLWLVNRQFHFKKKHSYDKKPLQPLKKPVKALRRSVSFAKKAAKRIKSKRGKGLQTDDTVLREEEEEKAKLLAEQNKHKSFQSFLEDFDEEDDAEDTAIETSLSQKEEKLANENAFGLQLLPTTPEAETLGLNVQLSPTPERTAKKKRTKDLLQLASKIEVFSYLSPEALKDILEYVEYVEFANVGDLVFDTDTLDGSMYAVVNGEITETLSTVTSNTTGGKDDFSFVARPGEVITSMLSIITSLVREYQIQGDISADDNKRKVVIPPGMNIKAVVTSPNTRLLRIPSKCFVAILEKFPRDVYNICQTIVARLQRVTIQTLVRFLGLDAGILGIGGPLAAGGVGGISSGTIPEKKMRNSTPEWKKLEQTLLSGSNDTSIASSILDQAIAAAGSLLGLSSESSQDLKEGTEIVHAPPGSIICSKGQQPDGIYLILKGSLEVGLDKSGEQQYGRSSSTSSNASPLEENGDHHKKAARRNRSSAGSSLSSFEERDDQINKSFKPLFSAAPGNWVGLFSAFTHDASFITVHATTGALLLKIPTQTFDHVVSKYPRALISTLLDIIDTVGDGVNLCVSPSMFLLDMSLDWMHCEAGEYIVVKGEPCDSMYVVLNGRLRAEIPKKEDSNQQSHDEYGRGATIGELEALAEGNWNHSVYAIRHVEVARIPSRIINILMAMFPTAGIHFAKVIASQVHSRTGTMSSDISLLPSYNLSLATIAVIPLTDEVDASEFCSYLTNSLTSIAPTKHLTKAHIKEKVGATLLKNRNAMLKVKMTRVLGDVEENNRLVVYESDYKYTWWTKLCVQEADCVLLLVDSRNAPTHQRVEEMLAWAHKKKGVRVELVVIQSLSSQMEDSPDEHASDDINNWSEERQWISKQHLVRCLFENHALDFDRVARRITGQSIGLVLGGGGARGLAHLGVIQALNEVGVPIDQVGGTSQGAFVGALLARNPDDWDLLQQSIHIMAEDMSSISNKLRELTFPVTSYFSGHHFNKGIQRVLGNARIQDFVLNFFCVSVDICNSVQMVHREGLAWKYVRASMGIAGYLPPISENGRLLVDGGYMNVLPADVMKDMGVKKIIAVDVAKEDKRKYYEYGTELSGLWLLWNSWNPFVQTVAVPSMADINERLSWVSSERTKKDIINKNVDLFLRPPVNHIGTLEYDKIDEVVALGYKYALPIIEEWAAENGYAHKPSRVNSGSSFSD